MTNEDILDKVLNSEGDLTNDPDDPGGITNKGISYLYLSKKFPAKSSIAIEDMIRNMTDVQARAYYTEDFINGPGYNFINNGIIKYIVVDSAVNFGPEQANRFLQEAIHINVDGVFGPKTIATVNGRDTKEVIFGIVRARVRYRTERVKKKYSQIKYLWGWISRDLSFLEMIL